MSSTFFKVIVGVTIDHENFPEDQNVNAAIEALRHQAFEGVEGVEFFEDGDAYVGVVLSEFDNGGPVSVAGIRFEPSETELRKAGNLVRELVPDLLRNTVYASDFGVYLVSGKLDTDLVGDALDD